MHVDDQGNSICESGCPLTKTIEDGQQREAELFLKHKDGHRIPVLIRVTPLKNANNDIIGGIEIFSDNSTKLHCLDRLKSLQKLAFTDPLTGLFNKRFMDIKLKTCLTESQSNLIPMGVFLCGIDRLGKINDKYGNPIGDKMLESVAKTLMHNSKALDHLGRWRGDEFLGIVMNVDEGHLFTIANTLRALTDKSIIRVQQDTVHLTISVGATMVHRDDSVNSLIERTNTLLKMSKASGRNKVTIKSKEIM
jgi:diguanylate cyclase (GGDEF)-like protein